MNLDIYLSKIVVVVFKFRLLSLKGHKEEYQYKKSLTVTIGTGRERAVNDKGSQQNMSW